MRGHCRRNVTAIPYIKVIVTSRVQEGADKRHQPGYSFENFVASSGCAIAQLVVRFCILPYFRRIKNSTHHIYSLSLSS